MRRQKPGHRVLSFHHRGLLLLIAAVAAALFLLYGCVAGAVYSPRGRLVFIPLAQVLGGGRSLGLSAQDISPLIPQTMTGEGVPAQN